MTTKYTPITTDEQLRDRIKNANKNYDMIANLDFVFDTLNCLHATVKESREFEAIFYPVGDAVAGTPIEKDVKDLMCSLTDMFQYSIYLNAQKLLNGPPKQETQNELDVHPNAEPPVSENLPEARSDGASVPSTHESSGDPKSAE